MPNFRISMTDSMTGESVIVDVTGRDMFDGILNAIQHIASFDDVPHTAEIHSCILTEGNAVFIARDAYAHEVIEMYWHGIVYTRFCSGDPKCAGSMYYDATQEAA